MSGETYYPRHSELDTQADRELDAAQERIRELEAQIREAIKRLGVTVERWGATERERDEARAEVERFRNAVREKERLELAAVQELDEARAEVKRMRFVEDCRSGGLTYECNLTRPCVTCRVRTVAERQREACAAQARSYAYLRVDADTMQEKVRATPLVTEGES